MSSPARVVNLTTLTQKAFTSLLSKTSVNTSQADIQGVWNTVSTLLSKAALAPEFVPEAQALVAPTASRSISTNASSYLASLVGTAHEAATAVLCGSILGGRGSESDDYSDYAIFIGELPEGGAAGVGSKEFAEECIKALGLGRWLESSQVQIVTSKSPPLPASLDGIPEFQRDGSQAAVAQLRAELHVLQDVFECRVVTSDSGGLVLHFLLGKGEGGWQGLGGASTWAEE
ncbi:hypothetical protein FRB99_001272 [Tulasnella sp. 403]|nr:hypothetical protein FRB99_001272 [Tulasnella sp. 403]